MRLWITTILACIMGASCAYSQGWPWWLQTNTTEASNSSIRIDGPGHTNLYVYRLVLSGDSVSAMSSVGGTSTVTWVELDPVFTNWAATSGWATVSITNDFATTSWVDTVYYPRSNPSNWVTASVTNGLASTNWVNARGFATNSASDDTLWHEQWKLDGDHCWWSRSKHHQWTGQHELGNGSGVRDSGDHQRPLAAGGRHQLGGEHLVADD